MSFLETPLADFLTLPNEQGTRASAPVAPTILGKAAPTAVQRADSQDFFGLTVERIATILVGLILIAAGIFMFRPVRETIFTGGKIVAKAAAA